MLTAEQVEAVLRQYTPTQEKVDLAVRAAIEVANPSRVILFGSWARGEAKWDSDLDMAILMPDSSEPLLDQVRRELRRKLEQVPMTIDLVMMTEGIAHQFGDSINSIYYRILKEGKIAYEQLPVAGTDTSDQSI